jgi:hypothetical protein
MITRLLVFALLYAAMFLGWLGVGLFMLLAPARFIQFVSEHVALGDDRQRAGSKLLVRVAGAGLVAFAVRFALRLAELWR